MEDEQTKGEHLNLEAPRRGNETFLQEMSVPLLQPCWAYLPARASEQGNRRKKRATL